MPAVAAGGAAHAAKDISQGGVIGTAAMLCECSGVGLTIDLDAVPAPPGADPARWLTAFPSYGYLFATAPEGVPDLLRLFGAEDIAAAAPGARSLLINSPNNPTGTVYSEATLQGIARVCQNHDLWLISDEV
ncbi:MAG: aminotransferase class I/II-fold pyridoxal phosphate-dependent enzyme, partial [Pseudomonadota bacterium]